MSYKHEFQCTSCHKYFEDGFLITRSVSGLGCFLCSKCGKGVNLLFPDRLSEEHCICEIVRINSDE